MPRLKAVTTGLLLIALVAFAVAMSIAPAAQAADEYPCAYKGHILVDGGAVPDGTPVRVLDGTTVLKESTTGLWALDDNEFYLDGVIAELGTTVNFEVWWNCNGGAEWIAASETAVHVMYGSVLVDLTATCPSPTPTPTPTTTPTPGPTPTTTPTPGPTPTPTPGPTDWPFEVGLCAGWSVLSTPVTLESTGNANKFGQIVPPADVLLAYRLYSNYWYPVTSYYVLKPLEGIYVNVDTGGTTATFVPEDGISAPPTRTLYTGWSLVGTAPAWVASFPDMSVLEVLGCIDGSYSNVVSPSQCQTAWMYGPNFTTVPDMEPFKGYFVYVKAYVTLPGWSNTPLE